MSSSVTGAKDQRKDIEAIWSLGIRSQSLSGWTGRRRISAGHIWSLRKVLSSGRFSQQLWSEELALLPLVPLTRALLLNYFPWQHSLGQNPRNLGTTIRHRRSSYQFADILLAWLEFSVHSTVHLFNPHFIHMSIRILRETVLTVLPKSR